MSRPYPCRVLGNYDGDTLTIEVDHGFDITSKRQVRLSAVDTPELTRGTSLTRAFGRHVRDVVSERAARAKECIFVCELERGKYGRAVGDILLDGISLQHWLVDQGLAVPYAGESRKGLQAKHKVNAEKRRRKGAFRT